MKQIAGKVAVVTGAGSGIGRALAVELVNRGARLAISDVDPDGLGRTAERCRAAGGTVLEQRLDVSDRAAVFAHAEQVRGHYGTVNLVVNNAGITIFGTIEESPIEDVERVMDVDFWGVVNGTRAFLPHLIASGDGHVVNISSIFGLFSVPTQSSYHAAKFAVRGYTEALRQEMLISGHRVGVTCVHPGGIKTNIVANATASGGADLTGLTRLFEERLTHTTPEAAATAILRGVTNGSARVLIGWDAKALDLIVRVLGPRYQRLFATVATRLLGPLADAPIPAEVTPPVRSAA